MRVLLIDDSHDFVPKEQLKNLIFLGKTYNDRIRYELAHLENKSEIQYTAPDKIEWLRDRKKLVRVLGLLLKVKELMLGQQLSAPDAAQQALTLEAKGEFKPIVRAYEENSFEKQILFDPSSCSAKFR